MIDEIIQAISDMISNLVNSQVVIGTIPPINGYAVGTNGGAPKSTFYSLSSDAECVVFFNGKNSNQNTLMSEMANVHYALTTSKYLPQSDLWQIYSIVTTAEPTLIGVEQNNNWIYGSSFRVNYYRRSLNG